MIPTIQALQAEVHENAVKHGWWEQDDRPFGELLALVHSEISEALEEYRNGRAPRETYFSGSVKIKNPLFPKYDGVYTATAPVRGERRYKIDEDGFALTDDGDKSFVVIKPEGIPSELADIVIRVLDIADHYGIDLQQAILDKHSYNVTRPYKHGGKKI